MKGRYNLEMNWINECFEEETEQRLQKQSERKQMAIPKQAPAWQDTWVNIFTTLSADISKFNGRDKKKQFGVTPRVGEGKIITIVPDMDGDYFETAMFATTVLQIDESGIINLTQPPAREGIGRRGNFKVQGVSIIAQPNFTGDPKPPSEPMTPEEFSKFVLRPFLFPNSK
jgi:hypothetical protein